MDPEIRGDLPGAEQVDLDAGRAQVDLDDVADHLARSVGGRELAVGDPRSDGLGRRQSIQDLLAGRGRRGGRRHRARHRQRRGDQERTHP